MFLNHVASNRQFGVDHQLCLHFASLRLVNTLFVLFDFSKELFLLLSIKVVVDVANVGLKLLDRLLVVVFAVELQFI